ncbi:MAG: YIP1 family protein, partial [Anaerolineales bacterium]|nr:YIP1 family protein [Anaerolineales bacterium]
ATDLAPRQNRFWREMLNGWMSILTKPNQDTFRAQKAQSDPLKTVLGVCFLGLVLGLWALAVKPAVPVTGMGTEVILVDLLRMIFFTEVGFFIISLLLFIIARGFGGIGSFLQQSYLLSLITVPLGMIVVAFLFVGEKLGLTLIAVFNPLSPAGVVGVFVILFALYGFLLLLFAMQAAHEMPASAVIYTLGALFLAWGILRVASMFIVGEENVITTEWVFIAEQWVKGTAQELLLGHLWLVAFSVSIAIVLGVTMGVFITWPARRPKLSHLFILIPLALFLLLWAASSGLLGGRSL